LYTFVDERNSVATGDKKTSGIIRKYGLNMSRQVFREKAKDIGFVKVCDPRREAEERGDEGLREAVSLMGGKLWMRNFCG
jgi:hypothetical protein